MLSVTKIFEFSAAHHLPYHEGKCKNVHGHGFKLEVTVDQGIDEIKSKGCEAGMIMDFSRLKETIDKKIMSILDHTNLNDMFYNPTAEVLVEYIVVVLKSQIPNLSRVRLYESSTSYVEWRKYA